MRLALTDDEGTVLKTWSIAFEYDYDIEKESYGEHDFYLFVDEHLKNRPEVYGHEMGEEVIKEIMVHNCSTTFVSLK
jgi:hypothetical protein